MVVTQQIDALRLEARERPTVVSVERPLRLLAAVFTIAYLWSTVFRARHATSMLYDGVLGNVGYGSCVLLSAWRVVRERNQRAAWAAITASLLLFTVGAVLWTTVVQYDNPVPYPSASDWCFLAFYPVAYLGIGLLAVGNIDRASRTIWLDGLIASLGVAAIEAAVVIAPISHRSHGSFATVATNLAYPIGDLVLVTMVVAVFAMAGWRPSRSWWTLGVGLAIFAVADSVYVLRVTAGTYVTGTPLDSLWLIGAFFIASAAWQRSRPSPVRRTREVPVVVPALFVLSSVGLVVFATGHDVLPLAVYLATGTLFVAVIRLGLAYRELRVLAETRREARTDDLTGLPNRRMFYEVVSERLRRPSAGMALLMIDLDRFKDINDSLGHSVGDQILRQLGSRLTTTVRSGDTVARLGGDEFGILVDPVMGEDRIMELADRVCSTLREPLAMEEMTLRVDASVGVAMSPDDGTDVDTLLLRADVAMYEAKRGHSGVARYCAEHDVQTRERLELMSSLRGAIEENQLVLHYQPKLDLRTRSVSGVEALVRWDHPDRGLLQPADFLELATQVGLMGALTMTVLDQALAQQAAWARQGIDLDVAVNLSVVNLRDHELPDRVLAALRRWKVSPDRLTLEITEDSLMADPAAGRDVLLRLRALGVALSIDDFGTGYSSLSYLKALPVSELKLDRQFVADLDDARTTAIVRSTVDLAHSLGLRLVAEGIEDAQALDRVVSLGCDGAQGFHLTRPVPATALPGALEGLAVRSLVA